MSSCDFWLFPKLKKPLKGKQFQTREDIMTAMIAELNAIPKEAFGMFPTMVAPLGEVCGVVRRLL